MADYRIVGYGDEEEYEMGGEIMLFVRSNKKFDKEVGKKNHTNPKLDMHELRQLIKSFVVECVN